jgi:hypothetical protein
MSLNRRFLIVGLTVVLLASVSCSDGGLTGVPDQSDRQPALLLGDLNLVDDLGSALDGAGDLTGDVIDAVDGSDGGLVEGVVNTLEGTIQVAGEVTDLLTCSEQRYVAVTQTIGPNGGTIRVGEHTLEIPANALSKRVTIKAEQMRGSTNSVRFNPEGLKFERAARLTMSYKNCVVVLLPKRIVYTTEQFKILEVLRSLDLFRKRTVTAPIDHFSRYAVAF